MTFSTTATDYTAREGEETAHYAARLATIVSPTVRAEAEYAYAGDLSDAVPLMILLTMVEKIDAIAAEEAQTGDFAWSGAHEIDVYNLMYSAQAGVVVINNDQMTYQDGHVAVGLYKGNDWNSVGEAIGDVVEYSDLDTAAAAAWALLS